MDEEPSGRTYAPLDPTYGQRSALPDLDDENEDGAVNEALEYLRSVRYVVSKVHLSSLSFSNLSVQPHARYPSNEF